MDNTVLSGEWLNRAFQLAYFIQGDKAAAMQIVTNAVALLDVAAQAQDKRLYYTPTGRALARKARTKVSLSEIQLLQRLIYVESEPFERRKEACEASVNEEDMITHFIKHLVKIAVKRNSFYVALGLSRLLHTYTTTETQEIYNVVVQDPERVKDDYYYRSRKAQLMRELKERFADLLHCVKGHRGEEKFQTMDSVDSYKELVKDCLKMFTPWATPCVMPAKFDAFADVLNPLSFKDADPDEEHQVEINRIHTLLHSECYSRLIEGIGFDSPELKLQIPQFFFAKQDQGGPKSGRKNPMTLNEDELDLIRENLAAQSARRKNVAAGLFRILVDGKECARFDVLETSTQQCEIGEGAEVIEVRTADDQGELLLASHILEFDYDRAPGKPFSAAVILEAGQKVNFSIQPLKNSAGEMDGALLDVAYEETSPARAARLFARRMMSRTRQRLQAPRWLATGAAKPIFALLILALCAAVVFFYFQSAKQAPERLANQNGSEVVPDDKNKQEPTPQKQDEPPAPKLAEGPGLQPQKQEIPKPNVPDPRPRTNREIAGTSGAPKKPGVKDSGNNIAVHPRRHESDPVNPDNTATDDPGTRNLAPRIAGAALGQVKRIAIAAFGTESLNPQIREALASALQATGRFDIVQSDADAVLKISTKRESLVPSDQLANATVIASLVNARGSIIWPAASKGATYQGKAGEIAARIAGDILSEVQKAERRK
jgi:hypothetical protein